MKTFAVYLKEIVENRYKMDILAMLVNRTTMESKISSMNGGFGHRMANFFHKPYFQQF